MNGFTEEQRSDAIAALLAQHIKPRPVRTAQDAFSMGSLLWVVKETAARGRWRAYVNQIGISAQQAERLIACARRFSDVSASFLGSVGSASNLFELLALSSDEIGAMALGLEVRGLTLAQIGTLTKAQLRTAINAHMDQPLIASKRKPAHLGVDEEHMLRLFRQCNKKERAALLSVASSLAESARQ